VDLLIRQADTGDMAALAALFVASALSARDDREILLANADALELSPRSVEQGRTRIAANADGHILGFCSILATADGMEVEDLFVDPAWLRRGVGRALILDVVAIARRRGVARLVVTSNNEARGFYEKLGFVFEREVVTRFGPAAEMSIQPLDVRGYEDTSEGQ
jgi:ribosomal protein S18 acetylase RimI-like enzyme